MIPRGFVMTCPGCDVPLEMDVCGWEATRGTNEGGEKGLGLSLMAWTTHECGKRN